MTGTVLTMAVAPYVHDPLTLVFEDVANHLQLRIEAGELAPGSRLPPERDLADEYQIAYNTLRRSVALLRERGLVITLRGHGNYVARGTD